MKNTKKLFALMLAVLMLLSVCAVAGAEGDAGTAATYTITAPNNGHTYEVYQIFTGELTENEEKKLVLSNIKWGQNGAGTSGESVDETILESLKTVNNDTEQKKLDVIESLVDLNSDPYNTVESGNKLENVPAGYYLIKDEDDVLNGTYDSYTTFIVEIVDNVTINPKAALPQMTKKVKDICDSDTDNTTENDTAMTEWQDSADWDIKDEVPFRLEGTVASNYDSYTVYKYVFHDQQSGGLTFNENSVKVYVDGTEITTGYSIVTPGNETDSATPCTFEIVFDDLKTIDNVQAGSTIAVEYTATLNENAVIGSVGNPNEARLEFSNNPNDETGSDTGLTPVDKVIVFTYQLDVEKQDENNAPLSGATFELYKKNAKGEYESLGAVATAEHSGGKQIASWEGLDDGEYKLEETETPEGYNTIAPIEFTITATHDEQADEPKLLTFTGDLASGNAEYDTTSGIVTTTIINKTGATLPETGGIGTTIFYVAGGVLVLLAVVLLVTKRRVGEN